LRGSLKTDKFIYINIYYIIMRKVSINKGKLQLEDNNIIGFYQKKVTRFGTGAKVDCTREYIGKTAYVIICDE